VNLKSGSTVVSAMLMSGAANCCVVERAGKIAGRDANRLRPASVNALRLTSATRTCSSTCWLSLPPGSSSMLISLDFAAEAPAISATRS